MENYLQGFDPIISNIHIHEVRKKNDYGTVELLFNSHLGVLLNTWEIRLRPQNYGLVYFNRLKIVANMFFSNPRTAIVKNQQKHLCK